MLYYSMSIFLEQVSFFGAIIGSLLIALNLPISGWAFVPFMLSNVASIIILKSTDAPKVITYQAWWFVVINCVGIFRWLV